MQVKTLVQELCDTPHYIHLEALGAPTLDVPVQFADEAAKLFAAYERVEFANPSTPLPAGTATLGGFVLAIITNTKYTTDKDENIYWAGIKWSASPKLDVTAAAYRYQTDSYQSGATAPCGTSAHSNCSGSETAGSLDAVYHFSKRFDGYAGAMYSTVSDGLAAGFVNTYTVNPTAGFRFKF